MERKTLQDQNAAYLCDPHDHPAGGGRSVLFDPPPGSMCVSSIRSAGKLWSFPIPSTLPRGRSRGCSTSFVPPAGVCGRGRHPVPDRIRLWLRLYPHKKRDSERCDPCANPKDEGEHPSSDPGVYAAVRCAGIDVRERRFGWRKGVLWGERTFWGGGSGEEGGHRLCPPQYYQPFCLERARGGGGVNQFQSDFFYWWVVGGVGGGRKWDEALGKRLKGARGNL